MIVTSHPDSRKYYFVSVDTDCGVTMRAAAARDRVHFQFRFFLVYSLLRHPPGANISAHSAPPPDTDPCHAGSYVQFYDGKDHYAQPLSTPLCGKTIPRPVLSTSSYLTLRLVTRGQQPRVDFVGDFTSFRMGLNSSECRAEPYFSCHNGKCIPSSLVCDEQDIDNCGDGSDQASSPPASCIRRGEDSKGILGSGAPIKVSGSITATSAAHPATALTLSCGDERNQPLPVQPQGSSTERRSLVYLYIILGLVLVLALLFWCCWSPGWFMWRISGCRFVPCCNSVCASCHLCTRSCVLRQKTRPSKVTPESTAPSLPV